MSGPTGLALALMNKGVIGQWAPRRATAGVVIGAVAAALAAAVAITANPPGSSSDAVTVLSAPLASPTPTSRATTPGGLASVASSTIRGSASEAVPAAPRAGAGAASPTAGEAAPAVAGGPPSADRAQAIGQAAQEQAPAADPVPPAVPPAQPTPAAAQPAPVTNPPGPGSLSVSDAGVGTVALRVSGVTANSGAIASVNVSYDAGSAWAAAGDGRSSSYDLTVGGLTPGRRYSFVARVCNSAGLCAGTNTVSITPAVASPALDPGTVSMQVSGNLVTTRWTAVTASPGANARCTLTITASPSSQPPYSRSIGLSRGDFSFFSVGGYSYQAQKSCTYPGGTVTVKSARVRVR